MDILTFLLALVSAGFAGLLMGLFGGGVGLVLVPLLIWLLTLQGVPAHLLMHMAIGTTLAAIVVIGIVATRAHHKKGTIQWPVLKRMVITLIIGVIIGSIVAGHLPSRTLMLIFGIFVWVLALYVWFASRREAKKVVHRYLTPWLAIGGLFIGIVGSVLGANPMCVPLLKKLGYDIRAAVGTTAAVGTIMAVAIVIMFIIVGWHQPGLPKYSTGYVDWAVFLPIAIASSLCAPLGVKLANILPKRLLQVLYGALLVIIGAKMVLLSGIL